MRYVLILLVFFSLLHCKTVERKYENLSYKKRLAYDSAEAVPIYKPLWKCVATLTRENSLKPYFGLCLQAMDSCKPMLFVNGRTLLWIEKRKNWDYYGWKYIMYERYKNTGDIPIKYLTGSRAGIHLWADYLFYFTEIGITADSVYIGFDMKVEVDYALDPPPSGNRYYRPRRNYPQIHVDAYFEREDTNWLVDTFVIHPLPALNVKRFYFNEGQDRPKPKFDCYANPAEEIPFPGYADSVWRLPPLPPLQRSSIREH